MSLERGFLDELTLKQLESRRSKITFSDRLDKLGLSHLYIMDIFLKGDMENFIQKQLMIKSQQLVQLYVIDAFGLKGRDLIGEGDPYLLISTGDQQISDRENYQADVSSPDFYKRFTFTSQFPGSSMLEIKVMDYDSIFGDDLVGSTQIDLEDRYYSFEWQSLIEKPIETRQLFHQAYAGSQGCLRLWVEINPQIILTPGDETKEYYITPEPEQELEVRVCVFDTKDTKMMDIEGASDVYVTATLEDITQTTETHWRCTNGNANFNYRLNIPFINKRKGSDKRLFVKVYDKDLIGSDELIGERIIDLTDPINDCILKKGQVSINKKLYDTFLKEKDNWKELKLEYEDDFSFSFDVFGNHEGKIQKGASIRIQIDIYPKKDALNQQAGQGRNEPNQNPFLAAPEGRFAFSLDPRKILSQLIGQDLIKKMQKAICLLICLAICIYMAPNIISSLISTIISKVLFG